MTIPFPDTLMKGAVVGGTMLCVAIPTPAQPPWTVLLDGPPWTAQ